MKKLSVVLLALFLVASCFRQKKVDSASTPVSHQIWDTLLQEHVNNQGMVNYKGFMRDSTSLNNYLNQLSQGHPNDKNWSKDEQLAYWINAYNAFTVQLIIRNYPVQSIKDIKKGVPFINTVWDIKFIKIEDKTYDLNNIEHGIIRPYFKDARIHFAVNCASFSCPPLLNEAFDAANLDNQLDRVAKSFINDGIRNILTENNLQLSKIFSWYGMDFKKTKSVRSWIQEYANIEISSDAEIDYMKYDWSLNDQN